MIRNIYTIAGYTFIIESIYNAVHELCIEYQDKGAADFTIQIRQSDIDYERQRSERNDLKEGIPVWNFSDSYLETLAVYRQLCEHLIDKNIILFHGSVIAVDGIAYLFTAKSRTGKSTHTRLWREHFGNRAVMINDDKPLIKIKNHSVTVYGTLWDGKHRISTNTSALRTLIDFYLFLENFSSDGALQDIFPDCCKISSADTVCMGVSPVSCHDGAEKPVYK